jgi:lipid A 4'-phosphatase
LPSLQPVIPLRPRPRPHPALWVGLALFVAISLLFQVFDWDLTVASSVWKLGGGAWPGMQQPLSYALYRWGNWPALAAGAVGGLVFFAGYKVPALKPWRGLGLYAFLLLVLGAGLLVNVLFKGLAGRPRPEEITEFGGFWAFARPFHFGPAGRGQSFVSGHVSMAAYWLGLFFVLPGRRRWLGLAAALLLTAGMGWARITQGGHFLSDCLLSAAAMFSVAAALAPLLRWQPQPAFWRRPRVLAALGAGIFGCLLVSQVVYEERQWLWHRPDAAPLRVLKTQRPQLWDSALPLKRVALDLNLQRGHLDVNFNGVEENGLLPLQLAEVFRGQGLARNKVALAVEPLKGDASFVLGPGTMALRVTQTVSGWWWASRGRYSLTLPRDVAVDARLKTAAGLLTITGLPEGRQVLILGAFRLQDLPDGFHAFGNDAWLRDGEQPQIALNLSAPRLRFQP